MFDGHPMGLSDLVVHDIETGDARPASQTHRRIPPHRDAEVEQLDELVRLGVLVESNGSWASPICIARKRSGKVRVACDMRSLNAVTELPSYPIPKISDVLDGLSGSFLFATLDMNMAYYQVKINPEHQQKATITTPWNNYSFTRVFWPFRRQLHVRSSAQHRAGRHYSGKMPVLLRRYYCPR